MVVEGVVGGTAVVFVVVDLGKRMDLEFELVVVVVAVVAVAVDGSGLEQGYSCRTGPSVCHVNRCRWRGVCDEIGGCQCDYLSVCGFLFEELERARIHQADGLL